MWPTEQNRRAWEERFAHQRPGTARIPEALKERMPNIEGKHVLHLPCGTGEIDLELTKMGALVTGVDPDEEALAVARDSAPKAAFFQADLNELPLQFRRHRFSVVFAGEGTLASVNDLDVFVSACSAALRKGGQLFLCDWHPVAVCIDPISLRWRENYFAEGFWKLGEIAIAFDRGDLELNEIVELPPAIAELGGRLDPRLPANLLLIATRP